MTSTETECIDDWYVPPHLQKPMARVKHLVGCRGKGQSSGGMEPLSLEQKAVLTTGLCDLALVRHEIDCDSRWIFAEAPGQRRRSDFSMKARRIPMKGIQVSRSRAILLLISLLSAGRQAVGAMRVIDGGVDGGRGAGGAGGAAKGLVAFFAGPAQLYYNPLALSERRICPASLGCQSWTRKSRPATSSVACLATQMLPLPNHHSMVSSLMNRNNLNVDHERLLLLPGSKISTRRMMGVCMRARGNVGAEGSGREGAKVRKQEASIVSSSRPPREFEDERLRLECAVDAEISMPSPVEFSGLLRVLADGAIRGGRWATVERAKEVRVTCTLHQKCHIQVCREKGDGLHAIFIPRIKEYRAGRSSPLRHACVHYKIHASI